MNRYQKAIRYTKPLTEIDEKIDRLNEMMTTSGMYTVVTTDDGNDGSPPVFGKAPLGDFSDLDNFSWDDQGDGSSSSHNLSQLKTEDADGNIKRIFDMPDLNYPSGTPYAMAIGPNQAVTGSPLGYISDDGFVFVYQINNVFSVTHTDFSRAFVEAYEAGSFVQKTIQLWGPLLYRVTTPITPSAFYPSDRDFDTTPIADKGLYSYNLLIPVRADNTPIENEIKTTREVPARPRSVSHVVSRNDLGDPNYYPGPVTNVSPEALNYLLARSGFPRNAADFSTMNVRGPHQPVKFYPGMGFGPSGPVQNPGAGGFNIVPQPRLANSYEPEGEVLSEDLTKDDFARLNKYVKDHPEELEYAFKRYPASDPRLSQLNFKMDEMMRASNDYVDKHFPINKEEESRVKKILARNIELSDPKTFKDPKPALTYGKVFGDDPKDKKVKEKDFSKKSAGRFLKTEKKVDTSRTRWLKG
jgi:hypothetical protein